MSDTYYRDRTIKFAYYQTVWVLVRSMTKCFLVQ